MKPIRNFEELTASLVSLKRRMRVAVVCAVDEYTGYAINRALSEGFADFILVGDEVDSELRSSLYSQSAHLTIIQTTDKEEAARKAVALVRSGEADLLMKGLINTDILLRAVLDKENGLLPPGSVLTHMSISQIPVYHKLLFFTDPAVIPYPTIEQRMAQIGYAIRLCHSFGIEQPRISLIHCSEKPGSKFPHTLDYTKIVKMAQDGEFGNAIIDGPLDVKSSCELHSGEIKGISSPIGGDADVLIFPNIEAGNVFYKTITLFANASTAGMLEGTIRPVVLTSRSDDGLCKYNSLAMACLAADTIDRTANG